MDGERLLVGRLPKRFCGRALGFAGGRIWIQHWVAKIKRYHDAGDVVVFTYDTHWKNYLTTQEGRKLPALHLRQYRAGNCTAKRPSSKRKKTCVSETHISVAGTGGLSG